MSKIKNGGLDQYGAEPFEQQQFGTAGVEGVKAVSLRRILKSYVRSKTDDYSQSSVRRKRPNRELTKRTESKTDDH